MISSKNFRVCISALLVVAAILGMFYARLDTYTLHILILSMVWALFATGWNLASGFGGMKAFGHQAFFAIAAYSSALLAMRFNLSPWLTMWLGAAIASLVSLVVVAPVLRLRSAPQIAIVTLAFAEIARIIIINMKSFTRGEMGLIGVPALPDVYLPVIGQVTFTSAEKSGYFLLIAVILLISVVGVFVFARSRYGIAAIAVRDAQDAAESLGLNATIYRVSLFALSAFIVGVSGAFYAHYLLVLTPEDTSGVVLMVMIVSMTIVGGLGTVTGPILGALILTLGLEFFRAFEDYRLLFYGGLVILVVRVMPNGIEHTLTSFYRNRIQQPLKARRAYKADTIRH